MEEQFYFLDGAYHGIAAGLPLPKGAVPVPRLPEAGETWDAARGAWRLDAALAADMAVPVGHIDAAHLVKQIEANLILSGVPLTHGLLAGEAAAMGIELHDLAAQVAAHAAEFTDREIARRQARKA